jgi:hypothetical protein
MWTGKDLVFERWRKRILLFLATLGVSIKNLMRERERNVEQVLINSRFYFLFIFYFYLDNENHGFKFYN